MFRRRVYELLKSAGIETPRNAVFNRNISSDLGSVPELIESEDAVQIGDTVFQKVWKLLLLFPTNYKDEQVIDVHRQISGTVVSSFQF